MLVVAKSHATLKGIDSRKMVIGMTILFLLFFRVLSNCDTSYAKLKLG
jgi:hypothetical protein